MYNYALHQYFQDLLTSSELIGLVAADMRVIQDDAKPVFKRSSSCCALISSFSGYNPVVAKASKCLRRNSSPPSESSMSSPSLLSSTSYRKSYRSSRRISTPASQNLVAGSVLSDEIQLNRWESVASSAFNKSTVRSLRFPKRQLS